MDSFSGDPLTDGDWSITLEIIDPISPPPEGLLRIDLTIVPTYLQTDTFGNPTRRPEPVRTIALPGTMSRAQYRSAMNRWLHHHSALEADVAHSFSDAVMEHVFDSYVDVRGKLVVHVEAELAYVVVEEDVKKGLCSYCVELLRDEYVFVAAEEGQIGDCSICLEKLVPANEKMKKTNYLFKSPCRHIFHDECMSEWLRNSDSCPLCRYVVSSEVTVMHLD